MDLTTNISSTKHVPPLADSGVSLVAGHKLIDIVVVSTCAVIAGAEEWAEICDYGEAKEQWFRTFLELPEGIPSHDTFGRVMSRIVPEEFGKRLSRWINEVFSTNGNRVFSFNGGKDLRPRGGSRDRSTVHMVNAWAFHDHLILGQTNTRDKCDEVEAIGELLEVIDVEGCVVTIDARECREEIASQVVARGGDCVFVPNGNQRGAQMDIRKSLIWCLDIVFCEEDRRIRKGYGPLNLGVIKRFALSLIKQDPFRQVGVKASLKRAGWDQDYLLYLLRV